MDRARHRSKPSVAALLLALAVPVVAHAADATRADPPRRGSAASRPVTGAAHGTLPLVDAEVRRVDVAKRLIVLKHAELPNLAMPAMTMGFDVADPKLLAGVKAGDRVRFQAEVVDGKATVTALERVR